MNLKEKRAEWEVNQFPVLIISQVARDGYPIVYVVCKTSDFETRKNQSGRFSIHRYFPIGIGTPNCSWECSIDKSGDLEVCLQFLKEQFSGFNKKVEEANWEDLDENPLVGML